MYFRILRDTQSGEITYLLADLGAKEAILVDPRSRDLALLNALLGEQNLILRWSLRTHNHDNMLLGEAQALKKLGAQLVQGSGDDGAYRPANGETLPFGNELVHTWHTPGHTPYCLSFSWRDRVFCGGLLTVEDCPYQPIPAEPDRLWDSANKHIFSLSSETLLFSGHAQKGCMVSTVMDQRRLSPYFASRTRDEFVSRIDSLRSSAQLAIAPFNL